MNPFIPYILYAMFFLQSAIIPHKVNAQIILRLWEAEASATANIVALSLIKNAEIRVKNELGNLNKEIRKQIPYYGLMPVLKPIFGINKTVDIIRVKLKELKSINNKVPLLFNKKKKEKEKKWKMYSDYLDSLGTDIDNGFSNNGDLLKTVLAITSELEKIDRELDEEMEDLSLLERVASLF